MKNKLFQGENQITELLLKNLNKDGRIHLVPAKVKANYIIRFVVTSFYTTEADIKRDWEIIRSNAYQLLASIKTEASMKEKRKLQFQSSLVLANAPQTPKIVNASFLAFFQDFDLTLNDLVKELDSRDYMQSHLPLKPRRRLKCLNNATHKGLSFEHLNSSQFMSSSSDNLKNKDKLLRVKFIDLEEDPNELNNNNNNNNNNSNNNEALLSKSDVAPNGVFMSLFDNYESVVEKKPTKYMCNQASLDSKIDYLFENADSNENG